MNREAAALGVPVYSIFRGTTGAVDRSLKKEGRLVMLRSREEIDALVDIRPRDKKNASRNGSQEAMNTILREIEVISSPERTEL